MKNTLVIALLSLVTLTGLSQTNAPLTVKGNLDIKFNTRMAAPNTKGIQDDYNININVANTIVFRGKMTDRPQIVEGIFTKTVVQPRSLRYSVECDFMNSVTKAVVPSISKIDGTVPIASSGEYNYDLGNLKFSALDRRAGSDGPFSGVIAGKPLVRPADYGDKIRETINISRLVNGKPSTVSLKRYDKMEFRNAVIGQGPTPTYSSGIVNGQMLYSYEKDCWFFNNIIVQCSDGSNIKLTGTIRYVKDPNYDSNGLSEYQFDVRVNEPVIDASVAFSTPAASDDDAFFANDTKVSGLTGTMKYKDTFVNPSAVVKTTASSAVILDLVGNNVTKQQLMMMTKIIVFVSVIPMNAD